MIPRRMRHRIRNWLSTKLSGSGSGVHVPRWKGTIHVESVLVNGSQPSGVSGPQAHRKTVPLNSQIDVAGIQLHNSKPVPAANSNQTKCATSYRRIWGFDITARYGYIRRRTRPSFPSAKSCHLTLQRFPNHEAAPRCLRSC